ncbi:MAG: hypothetical protein QN152_13635 [Armatimonadota bacterium]|nr:hypothetical protein [Armatimonadota bacterium]MDR7540546.1 hypothetical protein [Armatimonadota bacterium]
MRLRKAQTARRYRRALERARETPHLLFVERAPLRAAVAVEVVRGSGRGKPAGFWWGTEFYRIQRVVETRREYDAVYYRVVTDRGAFDLRRARRLEPWTLRPSVEWELTAQLEAIELQRPF